LAALHRINKNKQAAATPGGDSIGGRERRLFSREKKAHKRWIERRASGERTAKRDQPHNHAKKKKKKKKQKKNQKKNLRKNREESAPTSESNSAPSKK